MRLSFSAGQKYNQCPKAYFFHYIRKLRAIGTKSPLAWGGAIDDGLNTLLLEKDLQKANEAFEKTWNKFKDVDIKYSNADCGNDKDLLEEKREGETKEVKAKIHQAMFDKGLVILKDYQDVVLPTIDEVLAVQELIELKNSEGDTFTGVVDLVARRGDDVILFDNKTTSVTYTKDCVETSEQLSIYYAALKEKYSLTKAGYIVINKKLRVRATPATKIDEYVGEISQDLIDKTFSDYDAIMRGIKDGSFERDWSGCITKYGKCDYYDFCHNGSKKGLKEN